MLRQQAAEIERLKDVISDYLTIAKDAVVEITELRAEFERIEQVELNVTTDPRYTAHQAAEALRSAIEQLEASEPVAWTDGQLQMLNFLYGSGELDGVWFGEPNPKRKGSLWWRTELRKVFAAPVQPKECEAGAMCLQCPDRDADESYKRGFHDGAEEFKELYEVQPKAEPAALDITIDDDDALAFLRDMVVQADGDLTSIRLLFGDGHSGHGLYVASADYPEEGAILLTAVAHGAEQRNKELMATGMEPAAIAKLEGQFPGTIWLRPLADLTPNEKLYTATQLQQAVAAERKKHCACVFDGDETVEQCKFHNAREEAVHEWAERAKDAEKCEDAYAKRITELEAALRQAVEYGEYHELEHHPLFIKCKEVLK
jgi:hypothetical protein